MPAFELRPEADDDLDGVPETAAERFGIALMFGLMLLSLLMLGALFYLY